MREQPLPKIHPDAVKHQLRLRIHALRELPYGTLAELPSWSSEFVPFGDSKAEVVTYRKGGKGENLDIAVQCVPEGGITGMVWRGVYAEGFHISPNGQITEMADWERFRYM